MSNDALFTQFMSKIDEILWGEINPGFLTFYTLESLPAVPEGKMRIFHSTHTHYVKGIYEQGILSGSKTNNKEALPFIMAVLEGYTLFSPGIVIVADIDPENIEQVNSQGWIHIHQDIAPEEIIGVYVKGLKVTLSELMPYWEKYKNSLLTGETF